MNKILNFSKRNFKEITRDPLSYIFCIGFPVVMLLVFYLINSYSEQNVKTFELNSLIPGIMMFSYTFVMLMMGTLVSKDKETSFLKRLFTSPMKPKDFIIGYAIPGILIGLAQSVVTILSGGLLALIAKSAYFSVFDSLLLIISQIPILIFCVFIGILFGTILSDKSAPGISSIFISLSGILGGCWMPVETMNEFEVFCKCLPFYPSVYLGRIITNATDAFGSTYVFSFSLFIPIIIFSLLAISFSIIIFKYRVRNN